jgi:uncharacterized membrane protein
MRVTFQKFFLWVWLAILLLLASGYWMLFTTFGGFVGAGPYIHLMQMIGWLMIALFVWRFHGPWLTFKRAVDAEDWPSAGATLNRIRQIIAVNLPLGLLVDSFCLRKRESTRLLGTSSAATPELNISRGARAEVGAG